MQGVLQSVCRLALEEAHLHACSRVPAWGPDRLACAVHLAPTAGRHLVVVATITRNALECKNTHYLNTLVYL